MCSQSSLPIAAYWRKGCSSLGRLRYAALLDLTAEAPGKDRLAIVNIKEAVNAAAPHARDADMPGDHAERVVAGARALAPHLGERIMAAKFAGKSIVLRELMPQDLKIEIDQLAREEAVLVARYLAGVVGQAHGRQMKPETRRARAKELNHHRSGYLEAPSWLWSSVVDLMTAHEGEYLEHCRAFALADEHPYTHA